MLDWVVDANPVHVIFEGFRKYIVVFSFQGDIRNSLRAGRVLCWVMLMLDISGVPHTPHFAPSRKSANLTSQQSGQSDNLASLAIWPVWQSGLSGNWKYFLGHTAYSPRVSLNKWYIFLCIIEQICKFPNKATTSYIIIVGYHYCGRAGEIFVSYYCSYSAW